MFRWNVLGHLSVHQFHDYIYIINSIYNWATEILKNSHWKLNGRSQLFVGYPVIKELFLFCLVLNLCKMDLLWAMILVFGCTFRILPFVCVTINRSVNTYTWLVYVRQYIICFVLIYFCIKYFLLPYIPLLNRCI